MGLQPHTILGGGWAWIMSFQDKHDIGLIYSPLLVGYFIYLLTNHLIVIHPFPAIFWVLRMWYTGRTILVPSYDRCSRGV